MQSFKQHPKNSVVLILDDVRSLNNVGSAFRTADAFLLEKIYLCGITGKPPHREINKTALGATDSMDWEHVESAIELVSKLIQQQYQIVVVEQVDASIMLMDFKPDPEKKYALVFGNEVFGVNEHFGPPVFGNSPIWYQTFTKYLSKCGDRSVVAAGENGTFVAEGKVHGVKPLDTGYRPDLRTLYAVAKKFIIHNS